jgi:hypothetical protein
MGLEDYLRARAMSNSIRIKFMGIDCNVQAGRYPNGRMALELIESESGESFLVATVNLPFKSVGPREVFIKTWSENEGVLEALQAAGVLRDKGRLAGFDCPEAHRCVVVHPYLLEIGERDKSLTSDLEQDRSPPEWSPEM